MRSPVAFLLMFGSTLPGQVAKPAPSSEVRVFLDANAAGAWASRLCASQARLYWVSDVDGSERKPTIRTAPTAGGAFQVLAKVPYQVQHLTCGATGVTWVEHDEDGSYRLIYLPDGGSKRVLETGRLTGKPGGIWWLGMDASHVYWMFRDERDGVIRRAALAGGVPELVVTGLLDPQNAALDRNSIYISCFTLGRSHPRLFKAPIAHISDRTATEIADLTTVSAGRSARKEVRAPVGQQAGDFPTIIKDLVADGPNLYWLSNKHHEYYNGRAGHTLSGPPINEIQRVSKSGGTAVAIRLSGAPTNMLRIPTGFAFITEKKVVKLESGKQKTVYQAASNEDLGWLATDGHRVYWLVTSDDNKTFRTITSFIDCLEVDSKPAIRSRRAVRGA